MLVSPQRSLDAGSVVKVTRGSSGGELAELTASAGRAAINVQKHAVGAWFSAEHRWARGLVCNTETVFYHNVR